MKLVYAGNSTLLVINQFKKYKQGDLSLMVFDQFIILTIVPTGYSLVTEWLPADRQYDGSHIGAITYFFIMSSVEFQIKSRSSET